jgi:hypothetical protein
MWKANIDTKVNISRKKDLNNSKIVLLCISMWSSGVVYRSDDLRPILYCTYYIGVAFDNNWELLTTVKYCYYCYNCCPNMMLNYFFMKREHWKNVADVNSIDSFLANGIWRNILLLSWIIQFIFQISNNFVRCSFIINIHVVIFQILWLICLCGVWLLQLLFAII